MIYLDEIYFENFQSHRKTRIKLDKGVNIIHGLSGSGKTAILRALRLAVYNRPSGAKYYSNFAPDKGDTIIGLHFSDNRMIWLTKSVERAKKDRKKKLMETVYEAEGMGTDYSSGVDIPDVIRDYLNIGEVNIQKQFDRPFLIFDSPGVIARTINRITRLDEADKWKKDLTSQINKKKSEVDLLNGQAREIEIELLKYQGIETLNDNMVRLESVDREWEISSSKKMRLDSGLAKIENAVSNIKKLKPIEKDVDDIIGKIDNISNQFDSIIRTKERIESILRISEQISNKKLSMNTLIKLEKILVLEDERDRLRGRLSRVETLDDDIIKKRKMLEQKKEDYILIIRRDKKCPICFESIDDKAIARIEREL